VGGWVGRGRGGGGGRRGGAKCVRVVSVGVGVGLGVRVCELLGGGKKDGRVHFLERAVRVQSSFGTRTVERAGSALQKQRGRQVAATIAPKPLRGGRLTAPRQKLSGGCAHPCPAA
jgi:hypothetical protein